MTESVSEAITKASSFVGESIPVVDHENRLLGVVTEADLFSSTSVFRKELLASKKIDISAIRQIYPQTAGWFVHYL